MFASVDRKSATFKNLRPQREKILSDFCFSFLQVGYRPPKKKGQKAPKYTALRQVRTIRVTLGKGGSLGGRRANAVRPYDISGNQAI